VLPDKIWIPFVFFKKRFLNRSMIEFILHQFLEACERCRCLWGHWINRRGCKVTFAGNGERLKFGCVNQQIWVSVQIRQCERCSL
jgi:hypothetical protein